MIEPTQNAFIFPVVHSVAFEGIISWKMNQVIEGNACDWFNCYLKASFDPVLFWNCSSDPISVTFMWRLDNTTKSVMRNHTSLPTFILLGLTDDPPMQVLIFIFLFASYTLSVTGNLTIIILTSVDSRLKTAMYFFLKHFSFLEILLTTVCIPRFLYSLSTGDKTISYNACFSQIFFIFIFAATEFFLLAIMSYDRYVAICKPLHYATIMNSRICGRFVICCWIAGGLVIFPPLCLGLNLEFCDYHVIDHFLCDASPMLKISCSDTWFIEQMVVALAVLTDIGTFLCVVLSYIYIIKAIIKFPSA